MSGFVPVIILATLGFAVEVGASQGNSGKTRWICTPAGAGQTSSCSAEEDLRKHHTVDDSR